MALRQSDTILNPYEVLGVAPSASDAEIRAAYRRLAVQWHPDRNHSPQATERMAEINSARDILLDAGLRAEWDAWLRTSTASPEAQFAEDFSTADDIENPAPPPRSRRPWWLRAGIAAFDRWALFISWLFFFRLLHYWWPGRWAMGAIFLAIAVSGIWSPASLGTLFVWAMVTTAIRGLGLYLRLTA